MGELGQEEDKKPENTITIFVKDSTGNLTQFRIKKETKMQKVFDAYAQKAGLDINAIRFTFDGETIQKENTAKMLEMEDNDQIDVFLQQVGGK